MLLYIYRLVILVFLIVHRNLKKNVVWILMKNEFNLEMLCTCLEVEFDHEWVMDSVMEYDFNYIDIL